MNLPTLLVLIVIVIAVLLAIRSIRIDKKRGKSSCGGNCGACGGQSLCHSSLFDEYKKDHHCS